ncbi:MAG: rod shape-determining protein MreD [Methylophilaceae bacterium]|jgi:rod shape-determining protein MreD|nr:rod shape-determining protein MreD [Methylophilaceae bacterium]NBQ84623.1 rod shape-determining protein MreD [Methylophilaceae bacterium]
MRLNQHRMVYLSLVAALIMQLLPWSGVWIQIKPDFVLLVLLYWMLRAPHLCNIGTAWVAGLLIDLANGNLFGQNALAYVVTAFLAVVYQRRLILFTVLQQSSYVFLLLLVNQLTLLLLKLFTGGQEVSWLYFVSCLSSLLLWHLVVNARLGMSRIVSKH